MRERIESDQPAGPLGPALRRRQLKGRQIELRNGLRDDIRKLTERLAKMGFGDGRAKGLVESIEASCEDSRVAALAALRRANETTGEGRIRWLCEAVSKLGTWHVAESALILARAKSRLSLAKARHGRLDRVSDFAEIDRAYRGYFHDLARHGRLVRGFRRFCDRISRALSGVIGGCTPPNFARAAGVG